MICRDDNCKRVEIHEQGPLCNPILRSRGRMTPEKQLKIRAVRNGVSVEELVMHLDANERRCGKCKIWKDNALFWRGSRRCKECAQEALRQYKRSQEAIERRKEYQREYKRRRKLHDEQDLHRSDDRTADGQGDPQAS